MLFAHHISLPEDNLTAYDGDRLHFSHRLFLGLVGFVRVNHKIRLNQLPAQQNGRMLQLRVHLARADTQLILVPSVPQPIFTDFFIHLGKDSVRHVLSENIKLCQTEFCNVAKVRRRKVNAVIANQAAINLSH